MVHRFLVLVAFCFFSFSQSAGWFCYAGFPGHAERLFGIGDSMISYYLLIGPLAFVAATPLFIWMLDKKVFFFRGFFFPVSLKKKFLGTSIELLCCDAVCFVWRNHACGVSFLPSQRRMGSCHVWPAGDQCCWSRGHGRSSKDQLCLVSSLGAPRQHGGRRRGQQYGKCGGFPAWPCLQFAQV